MTSPHILNLKLESLLTVFAIVKSIIGMILWNFRRLLIVKVAGPENGVRDSNLANAS